jgi:hypothetical protein
MKLSLNNDLTKFLDKDKRIVFLFIRAIALSLLLAICISVFFLITHLIACAVVDSCDITKASNKFVYHLTFAFLLLVLPMMVYALILVKANRYLKQLKPYLAIFFPCWVGYVATKINHFNLGGQLSLLPQTMLEYVFLSTIIFGLGMLLRRVFFERS